MIHQKMCLSISSGFALGAIIKVSTKEGAIDERDRHVHSLCSLIALFVFFSQLYQIVFGYTGQTKFGSYETTLTAVVSNE